MTGKIKKQGINKEAQDGQDKCKILPLRRVKYVPRRKYDWHGLASVIAVIVLFVVAVGVIFWAETAHGQVTSWTDNATSVSGRAQYDLLYNAVRIVTPATLAASATPGILDAVSTASAAQKLAVRMAIARFAAEQSGTQACVDALNYILYGTWEELGAVEGTAISRDQREGILHALLIQAQDVINTEAVRLMGIANADGATSAPVGW